jgi:hypothetical protein
MVLYRYTYQFGRIADVRMAAASGTRCEDRHGFHGPREPRYMRRAQVMATMDYPSLVA